MEMLHAVPALPVKELEKNINFYRENLEFKIVHKEEGFAVLKCDAVEINLWVSNDETWKNREDSPPIISGAESFIAGTASCRIEVKGVDEWYSRLKPLGIVHPHGELSDQWFGVRDFGILDPDNNLISFYERLDNIS